MVSVLLRLIGLLNSALAAILIINLRCILALEARLSCLSVGKIQRLNAEQDAEEHEEEVGDQHDEAHGHYVHDEGALCRVLRQHVQTRLSCCLQLSRCNRELELAEHDDVNDQDVHPNRDKVQVEY